MAMRSLLRVLSRTLKGGVEFAMLMGLNNLLGWGTPLPMLAARISSGVAPFPVVLDCVTDPNCPQPPNNGSGRPDWALWTVEWFLDRNGTGAWPINGWDRNREKGPIVSFVYDEDDIGVHTIYRRITTHTGIVHTHFETITVSDPDDVWTQDGVDRFYVNSSTGNDANAGTLAAPWRTMTKALGATGIFSVQSALLEVEAGLTYEKTSSTTVSSKTGPYLIRRVGTGANPICTPSNGVDFLIMQPSVNKLRIVDIDIIGVAAGLGIPQATYEFDSVGSATVGADWAVTGGVLRGTSNPGSTGAALDYTHTASLVTLGVPYAVVTKCSNRTTGTYQVLCGTAAGSLRSSNTTHYDEFTWAGNTTFTIRKSDDFDGDVEFYHINGDRIGLTLGTDCLALRCTLDNLGSGFSHSDVAGLKAGTVIAECTVGPHINSYPLFLEHGYQIGFLGNVLELSAEWSNEHHTRIYVTHGFGAYNEFRGTGIKSMGAMRAFYPSTGYGAEGFTTTAAGWTAGGSALPANGWAWSSANGGCLVHTGGGGTTPVKKTHPTAVVGERRPMNWDITGRTAGSVTPAHGTTSGTLRSTNGSFIGLDSLSGIEFATNTEISFTPTTDFDGSIFFSPSGTQFFADTNRQGEEATEVLEYMTWARNWFGDSGSTMTGPFGAGPTNSGDDMHCHNCTFEENVVVGWAAVDQMFGADRASYQTIRNNIFDATACPSAEIVRVSSTSTPTYPLATGNRVYGNTLYCAGTYTGTLYAVTTGAVDTTLRNNAGFTLSASGTAGSSVGSTGTVEDHNDIFSAADLPNAPTSYELGVGVSAIGAGVTDDYNRWSLGSVNYFETRDDLGAIESSGGADGFEYLVVPPGTEQFLPFLPFNRAFGTPFRVFCRGGRW